MTESHIRNVIEAALLAAGKPLQVAELVEVFDTGGSRPTAAGIQAALAVLAEEYTTRGIELKETAAGFRIQVRRELANEISRLWPERPAKYTRAFLETLALIAYRQPITRGEIEAVRGVAVNPNILKSAIERNWVRVVGHRDVPGRPELLGTTRDFLDYFGLRSLDELPPLAELKAIGEIKVQFDLPDPGQLATDAGASDKPAADHAAIDSRAISAADADGMNPGVESSGAVGAEVILLTREGVADVNGKPPAAGTPVAEVRSAVRADEFGADRDVVIASSDSEGPADAPSKAAKSSGRGTSGKKRRGAPRGSDSALHEAEEFAASVDADLANDDDTSEEDGLSAADPDPSELIAGPRDIDE